MHLLRLAVQLHRMFLIIRYCLKIPGSHFFPIALTNQTNLEIHFLQNGLRNLIHRYHPCVQMFHSSQNLRLYPMCQINLMYLPDQILQPRH